jgi:four helix bundle protein
MKESIVKEKSFEFALQIIELYKVLQEEKEFVISKQLLRSGTSIGAYVNEALAGISKADFAYKMSISSKEARETLFWLQLLDKSQMVKYDYKPFIINCKELVKMLTSIVKTTQIKLTAENQKLKTKH